MYAQQKAEIEGRRRVDEKEEEERLAKEWYNTPDDLNSIFATYD